MQPDFGLICIYVSQHVYFTCLLSIFHLLVARRKLICSLWLCHYPNQRTTRLHSCFDVFIFEPIPPIAE